MKTVRLQYGEEGVYTPEKYYSMYDIKKSGYSLLRNSPLCIRVGLYFVDITKIEKMCQLKDRKVVKSFVDFILGYNAHRPNIRFKWNYATRR